MAAARKPLWGCHTCLAPNSLLVADAFGSEPSSATMTSKLPSVWRLRPCRTALRASSRLYVVTMTDTTARRARSDIRSVAARQLRYRTVGREHVDLDIWQPG